MKEGPQSFEFLDQTRFDLVVTIDLVILSHTGAEMVKKINALKARKNLGQLLEEVYYRGDQYVIERAGRPMAAVVPIWQLEEHQKRQKKFFGLVEKTWERNKKAKPELIEREVEEAVRAVRAQIRRKKV
jgi:prevent-host-death family protein